MSARFITADVFDGLAQLEAEGTQVDLVLSSPPFLAVRSYLPADHPDKGKEIGSEPTPAAFIDTLLAVVAACDRVLAPHGSLVFELGDTYAGSGGAGGDYNPGGWRQGQGVWDGSSRRDQATAHRYGGEWANPGYGDGFKGGNPGGSGWPLAKSKALIPEAFALSLAYGRNILTGQPSPAGQWRIRNMIAWCRTNPPVGALGDKFRPAHSEIVVACRAKDRWFDDIPTRRPADEANKRPSALHREGIPGRSDQVMNPLGEDGQRIISNPAGAPLLDWWVINNTGTNLSHYATWPEALCVPLIQSMCPQKVCRTCGQPSRRITKSSRIAPDGSVVVRDFNACNWGEGGYVGRQGGLDNASGVSGTTTTIATLGWTDCGHDDWRTGITLDPFAGTGTTLAAAISTGRHAIGIDLDPRNLDHARTRLGMFLEAVA